MSSGASAASQHAATTLVYTMNVQRKCLGWYLQKYCKFVFTLFRNAEESIILRTLLRMQTKIFNKC